MKGSALQVPCRGLMGALFGHHFEAQYSTKSTAYGHNERGVFATFHEGATIAPDEQEETYHGSVCSRCGLVVTP